MSADRPRNKSGKPRRPNPAGSSPWQKAAPAVSTSPRREIKYYGVAACLALWQSRPEDVIRVYVTEPNLKPLASLLKWAAAERKAYHIVEDDDLERLTESIHHQGVCVLAREAPSTSFSQLKSIIEKQRKPLLLVYLDGVENPHNFGAIVRTCAHFGVDFILGEVNRLPKLSPSACRVAEGGAEHVRTIALTERDKNLAELQEMGFVITATAARGESLYTQRLPKRLLLVMGAEGTGVSRTLQDLADITLKIPGTGKVESLNVSVAFSLIAGEFTRQHLHGKT